MSPRTLPPAPLTEKGYTRMDDPGQRKLPPELRGKVPTNYGEMADWVHRLRDRYNSDELEQMSAEHRAFLLYGFMAVTEGIHPRDAILVEKHYPNHVEFCFEVRKNKDDWQRDMVYQRQAAEIKSLRAMCEHLQKELSRLQNDPRPNKS